MNPIRRELLNGLIVLVVASLMSVAFAAFQVSFDLQLWVLILTGIGIAVGCYLVLEFIRSANAREQVTAVSTRQREEEWLRRVGNPARLEDGTSAGSRGMGLIIDALKDMKPGSDYTVLVYYGSEGGAETAISSEALQQHFDAIIEGLKNGTIREYKRIVCYDREVLANDHELSSGILRVGEGPGTIDGTVAKHVQLIMATKGCSVFVAPVVMRSNVFLFDTDKAGFSIDTTEQETGARGMAGIMFFYDPPNSEIIERLRQIERATERRMVAVRKIVFPGDAEQPVDLATR